MRLRLLTEQDSKRIHRVALRLLTEVGMKVGDEQTRLLLRRRGCRESTGGRLLFPGELVERALSTVPSSLQLFDRDGRLRVDTAASTPCFAPGLNCVNVLDFRTGGHRPSVLKDIEETARLCEGLVSIDLAAGLGNPSDLQAHEQALGTVRALAAATRKPLAFIAHEEHEDEAIWRHLAELAGGWNKLAEKPFALDLMGPYSPLELGAEACRRLRFAARRRLPVVCYPALLMGASGPVTLAGALAQSQAEILAGLVVHQLEQPGSPLLSGSSILPMDMRSGTPAYGSPEYIQACLGAVDCLGRLGVPTWVGAGCSDAHTVDAQAAAEAGMSLLAAACTGTAFVHNVGYLSGGRTGSLEMLLLCDELAGAIRAFSAGIPVSEDTLALETIRRAAPDRSFLTDEHTVANVRCAMWQPRLLQRGTLEAWEAAGGKTCTLRLRERLRELLDGGSG